MARRPIICLDVDGVLFPLGRDPHGDLIVPDGYVEATAANLPVSYHPDLPDWLQQIGERGQIVWATSWADLANSAVSPLLGLPGDLPVLDIREGRADAVLAAAGERPLVWCEDRRDSPQIRERLRQRPATLRITPRVELGLTRRHITRITRFLDQWG